MHPITLRKVRVHNLQAVDLELKPNQLIVFSGVSGSGKSSLAFDTIYADGQRRYVESLSTFARRYVGELGRPEAEHISGLSPTISIEQKTAGKNPRSTVGTMTEIYDYVRVLFARAGTPHCPVSGEAVLPQTDRQIIAQIREMKARIVLMAPFVKGKKGVLKEEFEELQKRGFLRARVDGQMVELGEPIELDGSVSHTVDVVVDRLVVNEKNASRIAESVTLALEIGNGTCLVDDRIFSTHAYSPKSGLSYEALEPNDFSFNSPAGMCTHCQGLGTREDFDLELVINPELSIAEDCCSIASSFETVRYGNIYKNLARMYDFKVKTPWKKLSEEAKHVFLHGIEKKWVRMRFVHPVTKKRWTDYIGWRGVLHEAKERYTKATSDSYRKRAQKLMRMQTCPECHGSRLKAYPAATKIGGKRIGEVMALPVEEAYAFFSELPRTEISEELLKEISVRLQFLLDVGLGYLALERKSPTLSGGEAQRVRLASQIGCGLVGVTYILDEPSIGLHPTDNQRLLKTLLSLRDKGNTVIVVEHDEETMRSADHIVDFGPGAGSRGGRILVSGSLDEVMAHPESVTGAYLSGRRSIHVPEKRRKIGKKGVWVKGAKKNNLKNVSVKFPRGVMIGVTGVSGSGKSSLVADTLYPQLKAGDERVILVDQSPIGRNPRSNPATYIKLFDEIRNLYAMLPESEARGYKVGRFSFNVLDGSCSHCRGNGMVKIDMDFMEDQWVLCEACKGHRFDADTLSVRFKGKNIYDVLEMEVEEVHEFFSAHPKISRKLQTLVDVGLGYLKLGQSSTTLSGGEAQRVKLAKELSRPEMDDTIYLLDEPTTGLHFEDVNALLRVLHQLVDRGNTVLLIEHHMDVIRNVDWIIDLHDGKVVAEATPEAVAKMKTATGHALSELVSLTRPAPHIEKPLESIEVVGARQNNLKEISAAIERGKITVCTGPSGSGKSSFAFETVYAEGQRRYTESLSPYARQYVQQCPKPIVEKMEGLLPAIAIEQKAHAGNPRSTVGTLTEIYDYLRVLWARAGTPHCPETGEVIKAIDKEHVIDRILAYPESERIAIMTPIEWSDTLFSKLQRQGYLRVRLNGETYELDQEIPYNRRRKNRLFLILDRLKVNAAARPRLAEAIEGREQIVILRENEEEVFFNLSFSVESTGKSYPPITPRSFAFNTPDGWCSDCQGWGCESCDEERVTPLARAVTINGLSLGKLCQMPSKEALEFVKALKPETLLEETHRQIVQRLEFLSEVGLHYLAMHRGAPTLSNGEAQRIRLARQLGCGLTGVLYVLDEPTVGLHPRENAMLSRSLAKLKDLGNTILMVEHDPLTLQEADYLIDFGPHAGKHGGEILARGTLAEIKKNPKSLTGAYLSGKKQVPIPKKRRDISEKLLQIVDANANNLQNVSVAFPTEAFSCLTGVSGSGKSTLMQELIETDHFKRVIVLDQNPIGHTNRADVGTYSEVFTHIRNLYASLALSRSKGFLPRHFSFNHLKGMCRRCWGMGKRKIEMHFLPPVEITCDQCHGLRLNPISLEVEYLGKNFGQLFDMTVVEAREFFHAIPPVIRSIDTLISVGLGYLCLGQKIQTLSGGEAQRIKLSRELAKRTRGKALYLLDEPTTGLHPQDVALLVDVLQKLVDKGHTLIVIEHNLDLIKCADYLVDLGPGAGSEGGQIVATGTPEEIAQNASSLTGHYLTQSLTQSLTWRV